MTMAVAGQRRPRQGIMPSLPVRRSHCRPYDGSLLPSDGRSTLLRIILSHPSLCTHCVCRIPIARLYQYLPFSIFLIPSIPRAIDQAKPRPLLSPSPHRGRESHNKLRQHTRRTRRFPRSTSTSHYPHPAATMPGPTIDLTKFDSIPESIEAFRMRLLSSRRP